MIKRILAEPGMDHPADRLILTKNLGGKLTKENGLVLFFDMSAHRSAVGGLR